MGFSRHKFTTNHTQQLAEYIVSTDLKTFSEEVVSWAKENVLYYFGRMLNNKEYPVTKAMQNISKIACPGKEEESVLWIDGTKASVEHAVLVNGTMTAEAIGISEMDIPGLAVSAALPVSWAMTKAEGLGGKEFLTAFILGCDAYLRIAKITKTTKETETAWNKSLSACQLFAGIVSAAKLTGLDIVKTNQVLGMGTAVAAIPSDLELSGGSDAFLYECGFRNADAVQLARCAKLGVLNLEDALDDQWAFASHYNNAPVLDALTDNLHEGGRIVLELGYPHSSSKAVFENGKLSEALQNLETAEILPDFTL